MQYTFIIMIIIFDSSVREKKHNISMELWNSDAFMGKSTHRTVLRLRLDKLRGPQLKSRAGSVSCKGKHCLSFLLNYWSHGVYSWSLAVKEMVRSLSLSIKTSQTQTPHFFWLDEVAVSGMHNTETIHSVSVSQRCVSDTELVYNEAALPSERSGVVGVLCLNTQQRGVRRGLQKPRHRQMLLWFD